MRCSIVAAPLLLALVAPALAQPFVYPPAPRSDVTDTYHGATVADPYRWLEEYTPETNAWIEAQNKVTFGYLESIPERSAIRARLTELWDYEKFSVPFKEGGRYFYSYNTGVQNQSPVYVADAIDGTPRLLIDPNTLRADGTAALAGTSVTEDGRLIAYGVADGGSDWQTWKVRDVATGEDLADQINWVKFSSAAWLKDGTGFFYSRFDEPRPGQELQGENRFQKLCFHRMGTPQSEDPIVYQRLDQPDWYIGGGVTDDGRYLVVGISSGKTVNNGLFYKDLGTENAPVIELLREFDAQYEFIANVGSSFYVLTDHGAPRWRVVLIDTSSPAKDNWVEIIPEGPDTLVGCSAVGGHLIASYLKDAKTAVKVHDLKGRFVRDVALPGIGTAGGFSGKIDDPETFYSFASYTSPPSIYRYDVATGQSTLFRAPKVAFDAGAYETRQVFFASKDGTRIPMFITHRKGLSLDGSNPTLLYGYGGFNISLTPSFSPATVAWMEMGGVYAVANLRGGGEYGEQWHQAGTKTRKQNVFDDFIGAAEWLIANKYTTNKKLAIQGGSNGGLLVGACMTQRPDLYGACLPAVGVMDMLRFDTFTVGWGWVADYGSARSEDAAEFKALAAYSPYHNLKKGTCYPPTLITTADHDDRVVPAHSFKYAAAIQWAQACANPVLIRIEVRAGHGAGKPTAKRIEEAADVWAFLVKSLGVEGAPSAAAPTTAGQ